MTNAERIRSMTDEELASFLCDMENKSGCFECVAKTYCKPGHNGMSDWLKQEATDDKR